MRAGAESALAALRLLLSAAPRAYLYCCSFSSAHSVCSSLSHTPLNVPCWAVRPLYAVALRCTLALRCRDAARAGMAHGRAMQHTTVPACTFPSPFLPLPAQFMPPVHGGDLLGNMPTRVVTDTGARRAPTTLCTQWPQRATAAGPAAERGIGLASKPPSGRPARLAQGRLHAQAAHAACKALGPPRALALAGYPLWPYRLKTLLIHAHMCHSLNVLAARRRTAASVSVAS
jgi:hypothetical protein